MKVLEMKTRQTLVFDPGGSTDHLRACPFLVGWCALLCGEVSSGYRMVYEAGRFWYTEELNIISRDDKRFVMPDILRLIAASPRID